MPVLLAEVLASLPTRPDGVYVDGTLGGGGHARALLEHLGPRGLLVGVDQDPEALAACEPLAQEFPGRLKRVGGSFGDLYSLLRREGIGPVDGILLDLGVSSRQLDAAGKGFSFLRDGPLDMRMDPASSPTAAHLVNELEEEALASIFWELGEESRSRRVARAIVEARRRRPLETTAELAHVVERALGRQSGKHPATRVFQALRIAVNRELEALDAFLESVEQVLAPGGRVAVISYHSLEDRRVKQAFRAADARRKADGNGLLLVTRKAVKPGRDEVVTNPRARSAKLRIAERTVEPS